MRNGAKANIRKLDITHQAILTKEDLSKPGIYAVANTCNEHLYVGQSKCLWKRKISHFRDLEHNCHSNPYLQNAYNHYGKGCFKFVVIEFIDLSELDDKEQYWIERLKPEYNISHNVFEIYRGGEKKKIEDVIPYRKEGESFDRPSWHKWVYGGAKNPLLGIRGRQSERH
jgi:group I intron endonuclease